MRNRSKAMTSLAVVGLFMFASPAFAADVPANLLADEVDNCVAEVRTHTDFSDAVRVRYNVVAIERRIVGYTMKIKTSVYGESDNAIREYAATCVVNGDNKPMKFLISETA